MIFDCYYLEFLCFVLRWPRLKIPLQVKVEVEGGGPRGWKKPSPLRQGGGGVLLALRRAFKKGGPGIGQAGRKAWRSLFWLEEARARRFLIKSLKSRSCKKHANEVRGRGEGPPDAGGVLKSVQVKWARTSSASPTVAASQGTPLGVKAE